MRISHRHTFRQRVQLADETASQCGNVAALKALATSCGFGQMESEMIWDQLISNVYLSAVQDKLLLEENLAWDKANIKWISEQSNVVIINGQYLRQQLRNYFSEKDVRTSRQGIAEAGMELTARLDLRGGRLDGGAQWLHHPEVPFQALFYSLNLSQIPYLLPLLCRQHTDLSPSKTHGSMLLKQPQGLYCWLDG